MLRAEEAEGWALRELLAQILEIRTRYLSRVAATCTVTPKATPHHPVARHTIAKVALLVIIVAASPEACRA